MRVEIGQIIKTHHGKAEVIGFERFDPKGMQAPNGDTWLGKERIICKLLPGHSWPCDGDYAMFPKDFKELNDGNN